MKLSDTERKILSCALLQADEPSSEIARKLGVKDATVRRCLKRCTESGIIQRLTYINVYQLGYRYYSFLGSLCSSSRKEKDQLIRYLKSQSPVGYVAEFSGAFELKVSFCCKGLDEVTEIFDSLSRDFGVVFNEKRFALMISLTDYTVGALWPLTGLSPTLSIGLSKQHKTPVTIDELDHHLLSRLSEVGSANKRDLCRELSISPSTLDYRIERLKKKRIIVGSRYLLNGAAIGLQSFVHMVTMSGFDEDLKAKVARFARKHPDPYALEFCLADWDFHVVTMVESAQDVMRFCRDLSTEFGASVLRIETLMLLKNHKVSNYPIEEFRS